MMNLDDGILYLCTLINTAENGRKPIERLTVINRYWYGERTVGFARQYAAKGVNEQVDMLVQVKYDGMPRIGMYAVLGNGEQFLVQNIAHFFDSETELRCTELTLQRLENYYDLDTGEK